jgi:transporter family protein
MIYIFLAILFYAALTMLSAVASRTIAPTLVAAIINSVAAVISIVVVIPNLDKTILENGYFGIRMAIFGGIALVFFALVINKSYQVNNVAIVAPLVLGGSMILTTILSFIFFNEKVSQLKGYGLITVGIGLVLIILAAKTGK